MGYLILGKKMRKFSTPKKPIYSTYMYNCKVGGVDESVVEGECVCVGRERC